MISRPASQQNRLINVFLTLISIVLMLLTLEILTRFFLKAPASITIENLNKPDDAISVQSNPHFTMDGNTIITEGYPDYGLYIYTPTGTRLKKNAIAIVKNHGLAKTDIKITTNAQGFRYDQLPEKKENDYRILVVGDSITLGDFVTQDQTYPARIEKYLKASAGIQLKGKHVQVVNAGVGSIDLQNAFAILMEEGLSISPDIVVVGLYLNDAHYSPTLQITRLPSFVGRSHLLRLIFHRVDRLRLKYLEEKWKATLHNSRQDEKQAFLQSHQLNTPADPNTDEGFNGLILENFHDWGYAWSEGYWEKILPLIGMFNDVSKEKAFRLVVLFLPVRAQIESNILKHEPQQRFVEELKKRNISYLDLLPLLRNKFQADHHDILFDHCHYKEEGNRFLGEIIGEFLLNNVIPTR